MTSFAQLGISDAAIRGLRDAQFDAPAPIQAATIPLATFGFDIIAQAKSGTGKTAAFVVAAIEILHPNQTGPQALIVAPTREITLQTADVCRVIAAHIDGVRVASFIGGTPMRVDAKNASKCEVACGTPGRLIGLVLAQALISERVRLLVLDEADKLAEPEFEDQFRYLLASLPSRKQTLAFSATYPPKLLAQLKRHMRRPQFVSVIQKADDGEFGAAAFGLDESHDLESLESYDNDKFVDRKALDAELCLARVCQFYALVPSHKEKQQSAACGVFGEPPDDCGA